MTSFGLGSLDYREVRIRVKHKEAWVATLLGTLLRVQEISMLSILNIWHLKG